MRPESILHSEAGYIFADCSRHAQILLALRRRTIHVTPTTKSGSPSAQKGLVLKCVGILLVRIFGMFFDNVSAKIFEDLRQRIAFRNKGFSASRAFQCGWFSTDKPQAGSFWHRASLSVAATGRRAKIRRSRCQQFPLRA